MLVPAFLAKSRISIVLSFIIASPVSMIGRLLAESSLIANVIADLEPIVPRSQRVGIGREPMRVAGKKNKTRKCVGLKIVPWRV